MARSLIRAGTPAPAFTANVWLNVENNLAVDHWGTYVTTPKVSAQSADINLKTTIRNYSGKPANRLVNIHYL